MTRFVSKVVQTTESTSLAQAACNLLPTANEANIILTHLIKPRPDELNQKIRAVSVSDRRKYTVEENQNRTNRVAYEVTAAKRRLEELDVFRELPPNLEKEILQVLDKNPKDKVLIDTLINVISSDEFNCLKFNKEQFIVALLALVANRDHDSWADELPFLRFLNYLPHERQAEFLTEFVMERVKRAVGRQSLDGL